MKIKISKYKHRISMHNLEASWSKWRHGEEAYYDSVEKPHLILDFWDQIAISIFSFIQKILNVTLDKIPDRTVKVKIDDWDTWDACSTLALIIHPLLIKLKECKEGVPFVDDDDAPAEFHSSLAPGTSEHDWDENVVSRWNFVLDEMIWAFYQQIDASEEDKFYSGYSDLSYNKREDGFYEITPSAEDTFKVDREGLKKHKDRIINGLRLFGKYYQNLWT